MTANMLLQYVLPKHIRSTPQSYSRFFVCLFFCPPFLVKHFWVFDRRDEKKLSVSHALLTITSMWNTKLSFFK